MPNFVRGSNPLWIFRDLVGQPLNDEYYISFLSNTFPYLPSLVYRDNQGIVPWSDPLQLLPNGGLPDNIYFEDDLVYRLEIRHGATQNDQLINTIMNYVPGDSGGNNVDDTGTQDNQISNPQFAFINFISPLTITTSGTYNLAPGWDIVLTGSGTVTITQLIFTGAQNVLQPDPSQPNSVPPYALRINTNGWTTAILQQRFNGVGAIWYNNFVSASIFARSDSGGGLISVNYVPNSGGGGTPVPIISNVALTTGATYEIIQGIVALNSSANTTLNNVAYVDIQIALPETGITDISNVQVMGQNVLLPVDFVEIPAETLERQQDHLFHYYKPQLAYKPIPSHLIGWDFPINPSQPLGGSVAAQSVGTNKSYYAWDQTILFQTANSAITVSRTGTGALLLTAAATTQIAVIQYLEGYKVREMLNDALAVNLAALSTVNSVPVTISLWYTSGASLPDMNSNLSLVATLTAAGKPATFNLAGGVVWKEVPRRNGQDATCTILSNSTDEFLDYNFNAWDLNGSTDDRTAEFFAIVIGTASMPITTTLSITSVGLMSGDIATRPAPQSVDEVLRECQYYYEKSYNTTVNPGAASTIGMRYAAQLGIDDSGGNIAVITRAFSIEYNTLKRSSTPINTFYSPTGTVNVVRIRLENGGSAGFADTDLSISNWTLGAVGQKSVYYFPNNVTPQNVTLAGVSQPEGSILYHFTSDARLGVI